MDFLPARCVGRVVSLRDVDEVSAQELVGQLNHMYTEWLRAELQEVYSANLQRSERARRCADSGDSDDR